MQQLQENCSRGSAPTQILPVQRLGKPRTAPSDRPLPIRIVIADGSSRASALQRSKDLQLQKLYLDIDLTSQQQRIRASKQDRYQILKNNDMRPFWREERLMVICGVVLQRGHWQWSRRFSLGNNQPTRTQVLTWNISGISDSKFSLWDTSAYLSLFDIVCITETRSADVQQDLFPAYTAYTSLPPIRMAKQDTESSPFDSHLSSTPLCGSLRQCSLGQNQQENHGATSPLHRHGLHSTSWISSANQQHSSAKDHSLDTASRSRRIRWRYHHGRRLQC